MVKEDDIYLEGKSEGLVSRSCGKNDGVKSLKEGGAIGLALNSPSLVPAHVGLQHFVSVPSGYGDKGDSCVVVADLLDEVRNWNANMAFKEYFLKLSQVANKSEFYGQV